MHTCVQVSTATGYSQGTAPDVTYEQVCSGNTGHAEVVQVRPLLTCAALAWAAFLANESLHRRSCAVSAKYQCLSARYACSPFDMGVQVLYNPDEVSYQQLLEVFTSIHNPTQLNRQVWTGNSPGLDRRKSTWNLRLALEHAVPCGPG